MDDDSGDSRGKSDVEGGDSDFSDDYDDTRLIHTDPSEGIAVRTRSSQTANEIKVPDAPTYGYPSSSVGGGQRPDFMSVPVSTTASSIGALTPGFRSVKLSGMCGGRFPS